eukprot:61230-Prorocentrum_lima.AAC.1
MLYGRVGRDMIRSFDATKVINCSSVHRHVSHVSTAQCLYRVDALIGSGKTMIISVIIHALLGRGLASSNAI